MPMCLFKGCTTNKTWGTCAHCGTTFYPEYVTRYLIGKD